MSDIEGLERVRDLKKDEALILSCRSCSSSWQMNKDQLLGLTREDTRVRDFADRHICDRCHSIGSSFEIERQDA